MSSKMQKIPSIRFKGFTDAWEQRKLEEVSKVYDGTHQTPNYTNSGVMFLSVENIKTLNSKKYISEEAFEKDFKIHPQKGDILMTRIGDIGTANVVQSDEPVAYYVSLALLKPIEIESNFLATSIATPFVQDGLWKRTLHIAFPKKINKNEIAKVDINVPSLKEQKKIGAFFKNLDNTIDLHQRQLDNYKELKKTMLQKILTQEFRLKDEKGNDYPKWKTVRFGQISKKTGEKNKNSTEYPVYSVSNKFGFILQSDQFENSRLEYLEKSAYKIVFPYQFAYNPARINVGSFGYLKSKEPGIVSSLYVCFEIDKEADNDYIYQFMKSNLFNKEVKSNTEGSVREYLFYENFSNIRVPFPSLIEQKKISAFLSVMDKRLAKIEKKIELLKQNKKRLMQQMFV